MQHLAKCAEEQGWGHDHSLHITPANQWSTFELRLTGGGLQSQVGGVVSGQVDLWVDWCDSGKRRLYNVPASVASWSTNDMLLHKAGTTLVYKKMPGKCSLGNTSASISIVIV